MQLPCFVSFKHLVVGWNAEKSVGMFQVHPIHLLRFSPAKGLISIGRGGQQWQARFSIDPTFGRFP